MGWLGAAAPAGTGGGAVDTRSSEVKVQKFYVLTKMLLQADLPGGSLPPLGKPLSPDSADYLVPGYGLWRCGWAQALRMATASPFQGHTCAGPPRRQVAATRAALAPEVLVRTTAGPASPLGSESGLEADKMVRLCPHQGWTEARVHSSGHRWTS